jgi:Ca2+/Na+ antiporter
LEVAFIFNFIPLNFIDGIALAADSGAEQTTKMRKKFIALTLVIFILLSGLFVAMHFYAPGYHIYALEAGNVIMALLSLYSYLMVQKTLGNNPQAFVRGVSGASFLKLMVCMVSILVYVLLNRSHIHKPTVFVMFGIYAVYTIMETVLLSKLVRE